MELVCRHCFTVLSRKELSLQEIHKAFRMNKCIEESVFKILWRLLGFKLKRKKRKKMSPTLTFQALPENEQMYSLFLLDIPLAVEGLGTYLFCICYLVAALKKKTNHTHKTFLLQSNRHLHKNRLKIHKMHPCYVFTFCTFNQKTKETSC